MLIALDWLKEYVDFDVSPEAIARALTMGGLELESHAEVELPGGEKRQVLELNVTPNRGYCLSYRGVAREAAALLGVPLKLDAHDARLEKHWSGLPVEKALTVLNQEPALCPRYAACVIENVTPGPSPKWLADRLRSIGLRPINNIVDITNFVMMEYGQPLHAFDRERLEGGAIVIRRAYSKESFAALDGTQLKLEEDALVIADAKKPVALAGIMGGSNSEVSDVTKNVVLESAYFDPVTVRKGSKKYGIRTDSSYRFERGVDIDGVLAAQSRAAILIKELAGGTILKGRFDDYPQPFPKRTLTLRLERVHRVVGTDLSLDTVTGFLNVLGFPSQRDPGQGKIEVEIPTFRPQLAREIDVIEEIARLYGYGNVAVEAPRGAVSPVRVSRKAACAHKVKEVLSHLGLAEAIHFSFIDAKQAQVFQSAFAGPEASPIPIKNPLSSDWSTMRTSLVPGLLATAARNLSKGQKPVKLFELGDIYYRNSEGAVVERTCLAGLVCGPYEPDVWKPQGKNYDFFDLKGALEAVTAQLRSNLRFEPASFSLLAAGKGVDCQVDGRRVGYLGELSGKLAKGFDLGFPALVFEVDFGAVVAALPQGFQFQAIPRFPGTYRDISILVDRSAPAQAVHEAIATAGAPLIQSVDLYDHFEGKKIAHGKKSLTFALTFQSLDKTLTDEEVKPVFERIIQVLSDRFGASLRE